MDVSIVKNLADLHEKLKGKARLVAVSKTKPVELIKKAYDAGQRDFGENKVQEMTSKNTDLPADIRWHLIGHLQTNKVKYVAPFVHMIHSVDSLKLLKVIEKEAAKNKRTIACLLQVHIAEEESKFGLSEQELFEILQEKELNKLQHVKVRGLMGMATNTENQEQVRKEFRQLKTLFETIRSQVRHPAVEFEELSMGMSGDYTIAIEEGSTMVRIGSAVFGERNYSQ